MGKEGGPTAFTVAVIEVTESFFASESGHGRDLFDREKSFVAVNLLIMSCLHRSHGHALKQFGN